MPVYARKSTVEEEFGDRRFADGAIHCGSCGQNLADPAANPEGILYVLYTDKTHLKENRPYEVYCETCLKANFSKAKLV
jgi:ribosomal protein L34E